MRRLEARRASFYLLLNPPTAAVLAFVLLGERLEPHQIVGGGLVLVAIAAASGLQRRQAKGGPV
jgi:drug/metabolite transporter (DMT)-like permease